MTQRDEAIGPCDFPPCPFCPARCCGGNREMGGSEDAERLTTSKNGIRYVFGTGERE